MDSVSQCETSQGLAGHDGAADRCADAGSASRAAGERVSLSAAQTRARSLEVNATDNGRSKVGADTLRWAHLPGRIGAGAHQQETMSGQQARSEDDFQMLAAGHRARLWRVAYRLAGNRDDAEDLLQESLIEAFQAFGRFRLGTCFERWVYRIMTRTHIDKFRRRKRVGSVPLEEMAPDGKTAQLADSSMDPQQISGKNEWSEPVQAALDRLAPEFRAVVIMCDAEGLSYQEASQALGCPIGTVRSRLHRARDQLRTWLRPLLQRM